MVLLRRGQKPTGPKLFPQMWTGPFRIIAANHPSYILGNNRGSRSRLPVHARRLREYVERDLEKLGLLIPAGSEDESE